jgi:tape measure domain-containing protein
MANPAIAKIGVEAVVNKLASFLGNMGKIDKSIKGLAPSSTLLGRAFSGLGNIISGLLGGVFRTLEYTLGSLLASAIQNTIGFLKELGSEIVSAADEFSKMELRLNRFNLKEISGDFDDMTQAQDRAVEMTKEQLKWLNKLAASTPFDANDVANTYSLARSYGFAAEEAKGLTEDITNFAAGMGLTEEHIQRIIINFGQMKAAGKITGTEIRDLARGAFVPVNDILERTADLMGITNEELALLRKKGLSDAEVFFTAFAEMADEDFAGAATDMNKVLSVAIGNLKDMARAFLSLEVVKGIMEGLALRVSGFQDALFQRWDKLEIAFTTIGKNIREIINEIVGLTPSAESMADAVVTGLLKVSKWLADNKDEIVLWVKDSAKWINDTLVPAVQGLWLWLFGESDKRGAIERFSGWISEQLIPRVKEAAQWIGNVLIPFLRDDLVPVFSSLIDLGGAVADVLLAALGVEPNKEFSDWIHDVLIPAISDLQTWIENHQELLVTLVQAYMKLQVILLIASYIGVFFGWVTRLIGGVFSLIAMISLFGSAILTAGLFILGIVAQFKLFEFGVRSILTGVKIVVDGVKNGFNLLLTNVKTTISQALEAIKRGDWLGAGAAIIRGMINGILINASSLISTLVNLASNAIAAAKATLGIQSPSTVFFGIGEQLMAGFARGITESASMAVKAMQGASAAVVVPAMQQAQIAMSAMPSNSVTHNTSNSYNLSIHSSAPTENVIQDFNMLESLS